MRYVLSLPEPIIKGNHCETSAIKRVFDYYNQGYSEQMLFGLGGGIGFIYLSDKSMLVPFIGTKNGRVGNAVRGVAELLSLELDVKETESKKKAFENVLNDLKENRPVIINVDMALLPYTGVPANEHFGGHAIALFGIDQECNEAYIYDRGKHVVVERLDALIEARSSDFAPFRPHNRSFHFKGIEKAIELTEASAVKALRRCYSTLVFPPIKRIGFSGMDMWLDDFGPVTDSMDSDRFFDYLTTIYTYIVIGGTGGDAFRSLFSVFLRELSEHFESLSQLLGLSKRYQGIATLWLKIADDCFPTHLRNMNTFRTALDKKNALFEEYEDDVRFKMQEQSELIDSCRGKAVEEAASNKKMIVERIQESILECITAEKSAINELKEVLSL